MQIEKQRAQIEQLVEENEQLRARNTPSEEAQGQTQNQT